MHSLNRRVSQAIFAVPFLSLRCSFGLSFLTAFSFHQDSVWRWIWSGNFRLADWKSKLLHDIKPTPEKIHLLCKKLYARLCSGGGLGRSSPAWSLGSTLRSMTSLFHWLLCSLCISNILLIVSNMLESLGALEVMWMRMNLEQLRRLALFCANEAQMIQKLQVELPGYLALLPIFFVSSHVFLSTTVLITVAITIERYQVEHTIFFSASLVIHITLLITCPTIIAIYQIKHVSPSCHIQTNITAIIT